jgi:hypothetical protein
MENPFEKKHFNLTEQGKIYRASPEMAALLEERAKIAEAQGASKKMALAVFNGLGTREKMEFISRGGVVEP